MRPLACIVGPTASGKSDVAEKVACVLGSPVVSVDAMQVYRGMDVGTAKVPAEERMAPLLMVDVADVGDDYSVSLFQRDARACVDALLARGVTPVLCGGTGLYLNAVVDEMEFPAGETAGERRQRWERVLSASGERGLWSVLARRDPASAELIHPNNARRVVRALEMLDEGTSYAAHHEGLHVRRPHYDYRIWGLTMDRERLYRRIDERVDHMFDAGLVEEVQGLCEMGLEGALTSRQAIGYKEVLDALAGRCTMDEASELVKARTRRYAKRQLSFFRHDERVTWINLDERTHDEAARQIIAELEGTAAGGACRG